MTLDIRGRLREAEAKLPGCSQLVGNVTRNMPEKDNVGASFFNQLGTALKKRQGTSALNTLARDGKMISHVSQPGLFKMFDVNGRCLLQKSLDAAQTITGQATPGIYILYFHPVNGSAIHQRILIQ
jgi:hypothetical protein